MGNQEYQFGMELQVCLVLVHKFVFSVQSRLHSMFVLKAVTGCCQLLGILGDKITDNKLPQEQLAFYPSTAVVT